MNITRRELIKKTALGKYSDSEIAGILGGNFERVLAQIWV